MCLIVKKKTLSLQNTHDLFLPFKSLTGNQNSIIKDQQFEGMRLAVTGSVPPGRAVFLHPMSFHTSFHPNTNTPPIPGMATSTLRPPQMPCSKCHLPGLEALGYSSQVAFVTQSCDTSYTVTDL